MQHIIEIFNAMTVLDAIDILIISFIVYKVLQLIKGAKTLYLVFIIFLVIIIFSLSNLLGLRTTSWFISNITGYLFIMMVIIFQPELRKAFIMIAEGKFFDVNKKNSSKMLEEIVRASVILANRQIGALIVFERKLDLLNFVTIGQKIDAEVSKELLITIFIPYTPIHDGAVLITASRLSYAGCILPLTKREDIDKQYGTRHRAAIGITEETDAIAIVVSEERGSVSVVSEGYVYSDLSADTLQSKLEELLNMDKVVDTAEVTNER